MGILESLSKSIVSNEGSNPFINAMSSNTQTDIALINQARLGSVLRNHKLVSGTSGSLIDATLDYFLKDSSGSFNMNVDLLKRQSYSNKFIPIIFKTEHTYKDIIKPTRAESRIPLYIAFDSTPESFSFSKGASWTPKVVQGRPEPVYVYSSSDATTLTLQGDFFVSSKTELLYKMKVSDYLTSLTTPSKYHFMPSPIKVIIGGWKSFRALVSNVTIDYKGPWNINGSDKSLPDHAPYMFTASISLILVDYANYVSFSEDIIRYSQDDVINPSEDPDSLNTLGSILKENGVLEPDSISYEEKGSGPFSWWTPSSSEYAFTNGSIVQSIDETDLIVNHNFDQFETSNSERQRSDLSVITNIVNSQLTNVLAKKLGGI